MLVFAELGPGSDSKHILELLVQDVEGIKKNDFSNCSMQHFPEKRLLRVPLFPTNRSPVR